MSESTNTSNEPDILQLTECPSCDYALTGLPPEGICPECGKHYDQQFVVLTGNAPGAGANPLNGSIVWMVLWMGFFAFQLFTSSILRQSAIMYVVFGFACLMMLLSLFSRWTNPRKRLIQVLLSSDGFNQRETKDRTGAIAWIESGVITTFGVAYLG